MMSSLLSLLNNIILETIYTITRNVNTNISPVMVIIKVGTTPTDIQQITTKNNPMDNIGIRNSQITSQNVYAISMILCLNLLIIHLNFYTVITTLSNNIYYA